MSEATEFVNTLYTRVERAVDREQADAYANLLRAEDILRRVVLIDPELGNANVPLLRLSPEFQELNILQHAFTEDAPQLPSLATPELGNSGTASFIGVDSAIPTVTAKIGNYTAPVAPEKFTGTAPDIDTSIPDIPELPDDAELRRSELLKIDLPELDTFVVTSGTVELPTLNLPAVEDYAGVLLEQWRLRTGDLQDSINNKLQAFLGEHFPNLTAASANVDDIIVAVLTGDRTAYTDLWEQNVFVRQQNRIDAQGQRQLAEVFDSARNTGNPVLAIRTQAQLQQTKEAIAAQVTEAVTSTAQTRAERELEHFQFILQLATTLRQLATEARNNEARLCVQVNEFGLQFAQEFVNSKRAVAQQLIENFRAEVELTRLALERLQDDRAAIAVELEIFRARLDTERAKVDINRVLLEQDNLELRFQIARYEAVNQRIQALIAIQQLKRTPLELFVAQVDAYRAQLDGHRTEVDVMRALIDADKAQIDGQLARVDAWLRGKEYERIEIAREQLELDKVREYNNAQIQLYEAQIRQQEAELRVKELQTRIDDTRVQAILTQDQQRNAARLQQYQTENEINIQLENIEQRYFEIFDRHRQEVNRINLERGKAASDLFRGMAEIHGSVAASALSGMNTLGSVNSNSSE